MRLRPPLATLALALPLGAAALIPGEADACSPDPCASFSGWTSLEPIDVAAIPIDGVVLLKGGRIGALPDEAVVADVALTVTLDGLEVAGALAASPIDGVLLWRPDQPLAPGAAYQVSGSYVAYDYEDPECGTFLGPLDFGFVADVAVAAPLQAPDVAVQEEVSTTGETTLETLVCCDNAIPTEQTSTDSCGGEYTDIYWDEGHCLPNAGVGSLEVNLTVTTELPAPTSAMVAQQLVVDGEPSDVRFTGAWYARREQPFCTEITLFNLGTGETLTTPKVCHGDAVADQLGPQDLDPGPELATVCRGEPYTCAVLEGIFETKWDPTQCEPWTGLDETTGGTTDATTTGGTTDATTAGGTADAMTTDAQTAGGTGATSGGDDDANSGCGCDAHPPAPTALLALALVAVRRRRAAIGP